MYTFLIILLILDSLVLVVAILLQAGKGGGLAASFGGATSAADSLIGTRQAGNLLTKTSWTCGGIFLLLAFVLQIASARPGAPASVLDKSLSTPAPAATQPAPSTEKNTAVPLEAAPKAPTTPAPATPAPKTP
jgi:preprotein translocase subunit SecG